MVFKVLQDFLYVFGFWEVVIFGVVIFYAF